MGGGGGSGYAMTIASKPTFLVRDQWIEEELWTCWYSYGTMGFLIYVKMF